MSKYIDPQGSPTFGLALCARCSRKFKLSDLISDPNTPGLMVCRDDLDDLDPYRLAPRNDDQLTLPFVRPDTPVDTGINNKGVPQLLTSENHTVFLFALD